LFAVKVPKIVKLADMPVEQPSKLEFIINLKTAKQIGVTVPPEALPRASSFVKRPRGDARMDLFSPLTNPA
jgi:putative ABC transport system substrate-binding protein